MINSDKIAVLLVNLGSPNSSKVSDVKKYLAEFLSDRRVVKLSRWLWIPILHGIILNTRPKKSAEKYRTIWQYNGEKGSPLILISRSQADKLQLSLSETLEGSESVENQNNRFNVYLAMRYGEPSISSKLDEIIAAGINKVLVLPAYPQYCSATTASIFDKIALDLRDKINLPELRFINQYYYESKYIDAMVNKINNFWEQHEKPEKLIFSYHGVPESYVKEGDPYYQQCLDTTDKIVNKLSLKKDSYIVTFQSRFGPKKWVTPYTSDTLISLAKSGTKSVHIIAPAFSADCLETLEEIKEENREYFEQNGGETYRYIPALNDDREHIEFFRYLVKKHTCNW